jgi:hypothetical protein
MTTKQVLLAVAIGLFGAYAFGSAAEQTRSSSITQPAANRSVGAPIVPEALGASASLQVSAETNARLTKLIRERYGPDAKLTIQMAKPDETRRGKVEDEINGELTLDYDPCNHTLKVFRKPYSKREVGHTFCNGQKVPETEVTQQK